MFWSDSRAFEYSNWRWTRPSHRLCMINDFDFTISWDSCKSITLLPSWSKTWINLCVDSARSSRSFNKDLRFMLTRLAPQVELCILADITSRGNPLIYKSLCLLFQPSWACLLRNLFNQSRRLIKLPLELWMVSTSLFAIEQRIPTLPRWIYNLTPIAEQVDSLCKRCDIYE